MDGSAGGCVGRGVGVLVGAKVAIGVGVGELVGVRVAIGVTVGIQVILGNGSSVGRGVTVGTRVMVGTNGCSIGVTVGSFVAVGAMVGVAVIVASMLGLSGVVDGDAQADNARKRENISITIGVFFRFIFSLFLKDSQPNLHKNFIRKALVFCLNICSNRAIIILSNRVQGVSLPY